MSQYDEPTNFITKINNIDYDLNSLYIAGLNISGGIYSNIVSQTTILKTVTFTKTGKYMVFVTFTSYSDYEYYTLNILTFSKSSTGGTSLEADLSCVYVRGFSGASNTLNNYDIAGTYGGNNIIDVSLDNLTWYLVLYISGAEIYINYRYTLNIIGPI